MALVHVNPNAIDFKFDVVIALAIEAEDVTHSGATASLGTDAQVVAFRDVLAADDVADFVRCAPRE